jgi:ABC-type glycerol-3-phosphate transport system substrate-binding protein
MRTLGRLVAFVTTLALLAGACTGSDEGEDAGTTGGGEPEPVTLDFWVFNEGGFGPFFQTLETEFEEANPNVDLNITAYPEANYNVKVTTAIAAGEPPDLVLFSGPEYPKQGLVLPLDEMVAENGIELSTFSQAIVQGSSCAWEDKLYCLGSYQGATMMLYNKEMFDAAGIEHPAPWPPMAIDEFVDVACRLSSPEEQVWGAAYGEPMYWQAWETVASPDGHTALGYVDSPVAVDTYATLAGGIADGCAASPNQVDPWEQGRDFFVQGKLAMVVTDFQDLNKVERAGFDWGTTAVPTPEGVDPYFYVWTDGVGVLQESEHPEEAMAFIAYLATEGQRIRFETTGDIPLDTAIAEQVDWAGGVPGRVEGLEVLSHARPGLFIPNVWDTFGPLADAWGFTVTGEKTAQEALTDAAPAIQENLDKQWETWENG